jgi:hypothetical protein
VAADWASFLPFAGGAVAAIGGGMAAAWLQGKSQERIEHRRLRREEDVEQQQRRERAASVLAEVSVLLQEVNAKQSIVQRLPAESMRQRAELLSPRLDALVERQQAASEQLILMAIREPAPQVRRLARQLDHAMSNSVHLTSMSLIGRAVESDAPAFARLATQAEEFRSEAQSLLDKLVEAL